MPIDITINGSITLDESDGLQTGGSATATEDNNDSDISLTTLQSGVASFYDRLFGAVVDGGLALSTSFATANGVAQSASNYISLSGTGSVVSLGFTSSTGSALPVLGSGTGVSTGLFALEGGAISLFVDPASELGSRVAYGVDEDGDIVFALFMEPAANLLSARVWMVQFEALDNTDATNHDDFLALAGLGVGAGVSTEFSFDTLPSGANLFGIVGDANAGLVVFGKNIGLKADNTFIANQTQEVKTSQAGPNATIGIESQMFDVGDAAYFTFVNNPDPNFTGFGLGSTEADDADNILYGSTLESDSAFVRIAQLQGSDAPAMSIQVFNIAGSPQGVAMINARGTNAAGKDPDVIAVRVYAPDGTTLLESYSGGVEAGLSSSITISITNGVATVTGFGAGNKIEWDADELFEQTLITGVGGKFDIGGFGANVPSAVFEPLTDVRFEDDGPSITGSIDGAPSPTVDESDLATNDSDSFAAQFTVAFGTDGAAAADPVTYALSTPGGASGLQDTATGNSVFLFLEGGKVVGREGSDAIDAATGEKVFEVSVDAFGNVSLDQLRAIIHPTADPDESKTLASAGLVVLTASAHDGDGDSASAPLDIGTRLIFKDDGPSITASIEGAPSPTVDESNLAGDDSDSFAAQFTPDFGEDGQGAAPVTYELSTPGGPSGLVDTATGNSVFLFLEGGKVVGREGSDATDAATGGKVFEVSVDASGNVTLDQLRAVVHPTADPDESKTLASAGLVVLTATAHDKDGDSDSAPLDIGTRLIFKDDGPSITASIDGAPSPTVDESNLAGDDSDSFAAQFTPDFGEDGQGAAPVTYELSTPGGPSGLVDTATGNSVFLFLEGGKVVGREGSDATDAATGEKVFEVSVDASGNVTLDQLRAVVHPTADPDESKTLASAGLVVLTATAHDKDGDSDSAPLDIGTRLIFKDDGPSITASIDGAPALTVDESALGTDDSDSFAAQFTPVYGADGQGAAPVIYDLSTPGGNSGIVDTATGNSVFLFLEGGKVVGREGSDAIDAATGEKVFEVSVDASGNVTLDQLRAIVHPTLDPDESKGLLAADMVVLTATATDKDGDSDSAPLNIGQLLIFKDDGPTQPDAGESVPPLVTEDALVTDDEAVSTADIFPDPPNFGSDGPRALNPIVFSLRLDDLAPGDGDAPDSGLVDTATGKAIRWVQPVTGGDIIGYVDLDGDGEIEAGDPEAVRFSLVPDAGDPPNVDVTFTQTRAVFHALADNEETILGNSVFVERKAFDGDGDPAETVDFDLSEITAILDDVPVIGPIPDGLVDFVLNDFDDGDLEGDVGNDPKTNPYTLTAFTPSIVVNGVTVTGVAAADNQSVTYWANTNGNGVIGDAGDTKYYSLVLGDQGGEGDYTFTVHLNPPPAFTEFNFDTLPSGANLFGIVGDANAGLVVFGKNIGLKADNTFIANQTQEVKTSQAGPNATIGIESQMFDVGDAAYFTFVNNPDPNFTGFGLGSTEADDADNILYGSALENDSAFVRIAQLQGGNAPSMSIELFNIDGSPQGVAMINARGTNAAGKDPDVIAVRVYAPDGTTLLESYSGGVEAGLSSSITISITNGVATVTGFGAGNKIEWDADEDFDQTLITGVAGKFDIGGFGFLQGNDTPDQLLEFTAKVLDGDGDFASASWKVGIDGTGIFDDGIVSGIVI